jgi:23S rRNA (pseudouridine1915-N3)-methyltransferase
MEIMILMINKTSEKFIEQGMNYYLEKCRPYVKIETAQLTSAATTKGQAACKEEGLMILKKLKRTDYLCLLDERGKPYDSESFAGYLQKVFNTGVKRIVFVIGGAYGFSEEIKSKADALISLSPMTFSHQLVRVVFAEQLFRALNIMHGGNYHH